ncbi:SDR family NAD(P)-dependent oxidoreductase [Bordetella hinzii]|uniref:Oxidoreductase, short chain dehydrogenase/reductase family protein n=1 Tax=Bordetella hinzii OH87 BAL007II TaxID=1331262 RepID=A0ABR4R5A3_9BORD|nr:SDR family NAD(P)-dependent oxidoreductase [Bordetella hinzii]AKQ54129.1 C-factor [Bordetella hinzii]KCB26118.1 oxidoreductase, short chain dehydrogenase/reductase family protein [Bordetella hinzii OH87 BAL007II]KCB26757.1 oxidoreductase, short chain dehydrogenase/reductase family protein [Bordetella hinzii L60]KCB29588.1 oxidoreductase, short chain dehydrogenase/reductase family protein [Bordetella hinzii CA90 BAL1384]KCB40807.1 oxidoreductase, short chain dehydrogenase/reductase family pr
MSPPDTQAPRILIIGASRGLGHAMAANLLALGWKVTGTVRGASTPLHALADAHPGRVDIETVDVARGEDIDALRLRLSHRRFDILFVNAGTTNPDPSQTIGEVSTEDFTGLMITNALGPMRAVERLADLVPPDGLIAVMSSGQGSIADNESGQRELYRGTKAALNQFMRCYAARQRGTPRALLLMAPGWVRTELGGPGGRLSIEESVPGVVEVLLAKRGRPGLEYLDYQGRTVRW